VQPDIELETWRDQWRAQEGVSPDLRRRVERDIHLRRVAFVASIVVTVIFGCGVPVWAIVSRRADVAVLAAAVWIFIAINWVVSSRLHGGLSAPIATTTAAFLDFSILNCRRQRSAIAAASALYVVMLTFNLTWIYWAQPMAGGIWAFLTSARVVTTFAVTLALALLAVRRRARAGQELQNLLDLRRQADR
jgi:hypothetical protein